MKYIVVIVTSDKRRWTEEYDWPVKTINGAKNRAKQMVAKFNLEEMHRYGVNAVTRTVIEVILKKEADST